MMNHQRLVSIMAARANNSHLLQKEYKCSLYNVDVSRLKIVRQWRYCKYTVNIVSCERSVLLCDWMNVS